MLISQCGNLNLQTTNFKKYKHKTKVNCLCCLTIETFFRKVIFCHIWFFYLLAETKIEVVVVVLRAIQPHSWKGNLRPKWQVRQNKWLLFTATFFQNKSQAIENSSIMPKEDLFPLRLPYMGHMNQDPQSPLKTMYKENIHLSFHINNHFSLPMSEFTWTNHLMSLSSKLTFKYWQCMFISLK